jgi:hypothetical protein
MMMRRGFLISCAKYLGKNRGKLVELLERSWLEERQPQRSGAVRVRAGTHVCRRDEEA